MRMNPRSDSLYRFVVEGCNVRGQLVYLDESWRELAGRHDYPPVVRRLLGEAVSAAALLSATIKFDGALRIQASGDGGLRLLIAEATAGGTVRGLARWKGELESALLTELLGNGRLAITIDPGAGRESEGRGSVAVPARVFQPFGAATDAPLAGGRGEAHSGTPAAACPG
jgi:molecular chaperone Hsp33